MQYIIQYLYFAYAPCTSAKYLLTMASSNTCCWPLEACFIGISVGFWAPSVADIPSVDVTSGSTTGAASKFSPSPSTFACCTVPSSASRRPACCKISAAWGSLGSMYKMVPSSTAPGTASPAPDIRWCCNPISFFSVSQSFIISFTVITWSEALV